MGFDPWDGDDDDGPEVVIPDELLQKLKKFYAKGKSEAVVDAAPIDGSFPIEKFRRFVQLEKSRKELKAKLKVIDEERCLLIPVLLRTFVDNGIKDFPIDGRRCYPRRTIYCGSQEGKVEQLVDALIARGCKQLVAPQTMRFSAWYRELDEAAGIDGDPMPEDLKDLMKVSEKFIVATRKI